MVGAQHFHLIGTLVRARIGARWLMLPRMCAMEGYSCSSLTVEVHGNAVAAGGGIVKEAAAGQYGEHFRYFSEPDGYLWNVVSAS